MAEAVTINIFLLLVLCFLFAFLWQKYQYHWYEKVDPDTLAMVHLTDFLLSQEELRNAKKPILWIHIPYEYNARNWESWGSRSSTDLNQPYLYLCIQSILRHCDKSFKICVIDDASFARLLPTNTIDMSNLSCPILPKIRQIQLFKLLQEYGGMICPVSFVCLRDLIGLFQEGTAAARPFICSGSTGMMGVPQKQDPVLLEVLHYAEQILSQDYTAESLFLNKVDKFSETRMSLLPGKLVGTETQQNQPIVLEDLFSDNFSIVPFYSEMYGIWIPMQDLLSRRQYGWFVRSSVAQLLSAEPATLLEKYFILANAPPGLREEFQTSVQTIPDLEVGAPPSKWISFWRTPSGVYSYGLKPTLLGYQVPHKNQA